MNEKTTTIVVDRTKEMTIMTEGLRTEVAKKDIRIIKVEVKILVIMTEIIMKKINIVKMNNNLNMIETKAIIRETAIQEVEEVETKENLREEGTSKEITEISYIKLKFDLKII